MAEASNVAYTQQYHGDTVSVTYGEVVKKAWGSDAVQLTVLAVYLTGPKNTNVL